MQASETVSDEFRELFGNEIADEAEEYMRNYPVLIADF
jgi:hypothetical protein